MLSGPGNSMKYAQIIYVHAGRHFQDGRQNNDSLNKSACCSLNALTLLSNIYTHLCFVNKSNGAHSIEAILKLNVLYW